MHAIIVPVAQMAHVVQGFEGRFGVLKLQNMNIFWLILAQIACDRLNCSRSSFHIGCCREGVRMGSIFLSRRPEKNRIAFASLSFMTESCVSCGSCNKLSTWVTRARERPSRRAKIALVSSVLFANSSRHFSASRSVCSH